MKEVFNKGSQRSGKVRLMFQDEAGFGRINKPRSCWCFPGLRPTVPCHHIREYRYAYGAVEPLTGDSFFLVMPYCNTECMNIYLEKLSKTFPGDYILLATVASDGTVTAVATGTAEITVTSPQALGKSAKCTVNVGTTEYLYSAYSLPAGLSIHRESGEITGVPKTEGVYKSIIISRAKNNANDMVSNEIEFNIGTGVPVETSDKTLLIAAIGTANNNKAGVATSVDGNDVPVGTSWVSPGAMIAYSIKIAAATGVNASASVSQAEIDSAASALNTASATFLAARQMGKWLGQKGPIAENSIAINYRNETTTQNISSDIEYKFSTASTFTQATGAPVALSPGSAAKTMQFRYRAKDGMDAGPVYELSIPARPTASLAGVFKIEASGGQFVLRTIGKVYGTGLAAAQRFIEYSSDGGVSWKPVVFRVGNAAGADSGNDEWPGAGNVNNVSRPFDAATADSVTIRVGAHEGGTGTQRPGTGIPTGTRAASFAGATSYKPNA